MKQKSRKIKMPFGKKTAKIIATGVTVVALVTSFGLFSITGGQTEDDMTYEKVTETEVVENTTVAETTESVEVASEIVSEVKTTVSKLSVNNKKVYSDAAVTAPHNLNSEEEADQKAAEAADEAEKEIKEVVKTETVNVGETIETTTTAKVAAKYVVSENNDTVKRVISCGYPNNNFGLNDKDAKSITYAAIQYLCEGKTYTGAYVEEFEKLVQAAQTYNGAFLLDGVTIIER